MNGRGTVTIERTMPWPVGTYRWSLNQVSPSMRGTGSGFGMAAPPPIRFIFTAPSSRTSAGEVASRNPVSGRFENA